MDRLKAFIEHPVINLTIAIVLISTSLAEGWESFSSDLSDIHVGAHHGVLLFGIAMLVRGIVEALESFVRANEKRKSTIKNGIVTTGSE
ncbi:MAG: hypothetical protein HON77_17550 [Gammaproteobacteria bacterium]|jgi:uncharacterized membrane protein HdeD (DUF308 family)|nr:hypothetical protein [Gammaproteobacteria bacterium]MBT6586107.1 hypothetical protein [Gammaproteobacteria bacterium]MBT6892203.1 hypothetical protein [Gammaproteobacteria bacterium]